jgi:TPR repeat protein
MNPNDHSGPVLGVAQALSYIEAAADGGNVQALRRLAEMHEQGEAGVARKDVRKALKYYRCVCAYVCVCALACRWN